VKTPSLQIRRGASLFKPGAIQFVQANGTKRTRSGGRVGAQGRDCSARLGELYWASNRPSGAEQALKAAVEIDPKNVDANRALGAFYLATAAARSGAAVQAIAASVARQRPS
jgi:hypothetical protein